LTIHHYTDKADKTKPDKTMQFSPSLVSAATLSTMLCGYYNQTPRVQIVRVSSSASTGLERVVFPWSWLLFETRPEAELEIYSDEPDAPQSAIRIACHDLKIKA
jgi:hypothetical protein